MKAKSPRSRSAKAADATPDSDPVRERILAAFSTKAKRAGIRAVVMGELASDLRMSAMTLYKHFPSKDELVSAMVDAWALELAAIGALDLGQLDDSDSAIDRLLAWLFLHLRAPQQRAASRSDHDRP